MKEPPNITWNWAFFLGFLSHRVTHLVWLEDGDWVSIVVIFILVVLLLPWNREVTESKTNLGGGNSNSFYCHPEPWGRWTHFDQHIFQMGWFNHQLETANQLGFSVKMFLWRFVVHQVWPNVISYNAATGPRSHEGCHGFLIDIHQDGFQTYLGGGNSNIFWFSPRTLGKVSNLTNIFFKWVGSTTN